MVTAALQPLLEQTLAMKIARINPLRGEKRCIAGFQNAVLQSCHMKSGQVPENASNAHGSARLGGRCADRIFPQTSPAMR
ncbi:MAG: hypothetical protein WAT78_12895 [Rhizobiaceae bacterium]